MNASFRRRLWSCGVGLLVLVACFALGNGMVMLAAPSFWLRFVPSLGAVGVPSHHLIQDVGLAYLASGIVLGLAAAVPEQRRNATLAGSAWLGAHAALHLVQGIANPAAWVSKVELLGIYGPPLLVGLAVAMLALDAQGQRT